MHKLLFSFSILFFSFSCTEKNNSQATAYIIHSANELTFNSSVIYDIGMLDVRDSSFTISAKSKKQFNPNIKKPTLCFIQANDKNFPLFILPQKQVEVFFKGKEDGVEYSFTEDDFMNNFAKEFHSDVIQLLEVGSEEKNILSKINSTQEKFIQKLEKIKNNLTDAEYLVLQGMVNGKSTHLKFILSETENPKDAYFDFVEGFQFNNDYFLTYSDNLSATLDVIRTRYFREFGIDFENATNSIEFISKNIESKPLRDQILAFLISQKIPKLTLEKKDEHLLKLKNIEFDENYMQFLKKITPSSAPGTVIGEKAIFPQSLISFSNDFNADDLKGKKIFVDNWATWCGPCMKSMKAFQQKKEELFQQENCIFVFVSFDRNEDVWRKYISNNFPEEKNVIHLFNGIDMKTEYGKYYNMSSLPTYIFVDENGKIADLNPPHPADSTFLDYFR